MARPKSEWPNKVLALIQSGNHTAAVAQIKVAPTVGDITRLQTLLEKLPPSPALQQLKNLSKKSAPCWPRPACTAHHDLRTRFHPDRRL